MHDTFWRNTKPQSGMRRKHISMKHPKVRYQGKQFRVGQTKIPSSWHFGVGSNTSELMRKLTETILRDATNAVSKKYDSAGHKSRCKYPMQTSTGNTSNAAEEM